MATLRRNGILIQATEQHDEHEIKSIRTAYGIMDAELDDPLETSTMCQSSSLARCKHAHSFTELLSESSRLSESSPHTSTTATAPPAVWVPQYSRWPEMSTEQRSSSSKHHRVSSSMTWPQLTWGRHIYIYHKRGQGGMRAAAAAPALISLPAFEALLVPSSRLCHHQLLLLLPPPTILHSPLRSCWPPPTHPHSYTVFGISAANKYCFFEQIYSKRSMKSSAFNVLQFVLQRFGGLEFERSYYSC